jgi:hypothetical protein
MTIILPCFNITYIEFHGFGQAKFAYGGLVLGTSQFTAIAHDPITSKVVKINQK